ncbi:MAG TPA: HAMP domain-containing sensor histidine kinase, partial [Trichocoleus sp.]
MTALLLMLALDPYIYLTRASFLLFFGAVTVAALYGGRGPGTVATLLSALFASYFFIDERYSLNFNFPDGMRLLLFVLQGLLISALVGALQQSQQQTRYSLHRLQNSEAEIKALNQALQQQVVELRAAREQAEAANRIKDEFLAVLSHELRSPLNPILGWVKLLRSNKLDPAKVSYALDTIERNAKLQALLVEDLLDVSRILHGKIALNVHPVDLLTIVEAAVETTRFSAEAKGIQIKTVL